MMHIAWGNIVDVPYCFSRSYIKFQGHTALKIVEFDPKWAFPDCNFSLNSPMALKSCTKLETAKENCPIVFQGHPSNFEVTRYKTSSILTQIGCFRTIGRSQLSNPSDLPCYFLRAFLALKHREIDENPHRSIAAPLLFTVGQPIVVLWRHANNNCASFWAIVLRTFPSGPRASSCPRQVDYYSLIIESDSRRFHWLAYKNVTYYIFCIVSLVSANYNTSFIVFYIYFFLKGVEKYVYVYVLYFMHT